MYFIKQFQPVFLSYLQEHKLDKPPHNLYRPADYILQLGGKRLRPILVLAACDLFNKNYEKALPAALSIEIFHNFTLVHDDIMDEAELRRGAPTVHKKYDTNTAILSGDLMLIEAYKQLSTLKAFSNLSQIYDIFNDFAIKVCEGQQYDMDFETQEQVSIDEYLKMIELKTAVLIAGALKIGAIIGDAEASNVYHLGEFGRAIGVAFQIQDDLLDSFGDPQKFGKKVGGDILQSKKTYLYLKALEIANNAQRQQLQNLYFEDSLPAEEKIDRVKKIFQDLAIPTLTIAKRDEFYRRAITHLDKIQIEEDRKKHFVEFADSLVDREV